MSLSDASSTDSLISSSRQSGRQLAVSADQEAIRSRLDLNQSEFLATLDISTYDAYTAIKEGRDVCVALGLIVRGVQIQSIAMQAATAREILAGVDYETAANDVMSAMATHVKFYGFNAFKLSAGYTFLSAPVELWPGIGDRRDAVTLAMTNGFNQLESRMPNCQPLQAWQREILNLHNTRRALHCAQPMTWSSALASKAAGWAFQCPTDSNSRNPDSVNQNVAYRATPTNDALEVVTVLFETWYDFQKENGNYDYSRAIGPCDNGNGIVYDGRGCVPASDNARARIHPACGRPRRDGMRVGPLRYLWCKGARLRVLEEGMHRRRVSWQCRQRVPRQR